MEICELCQGCSSDKCQGDSSEKVLPEGVVLPLVSSVFLILTERCPLACKYCFVSQHPREMSLETAIRAVDMCFENTEGNTKYVPNICFFGGEPLLRWDDIIVPVVEYIKERYPDRKYSLNMTTNGVLLTEDRLKYMVDNGLAFLFSLDGHKTCQDTNRIYHNGRGSFDDIPIDLVLKYLPHTTVRGTFDYNSVQHLFESMKFMYDKGFEVTFFHPNMSGNWTDETILEMKRQLRLFSDYYISRAREGVIIKHIPLDTAISDVIKLNQCISNGQAFSDYQERAFTKKCGIGAGAGASIGTNGDMFTCQEMPSNFMDDEDTVFKFGNVYTGVDETKRVQAATNFDPNRIEGYKGEEMCKNCKIKRICDGGCAAVNWRHTGFFEKPPRMYCELQNTLFDEAAYVIQVLGEEKNEAFRNRYFLKRDKTKGGVVYAE